MLRTMQIAFLRVSASAFFVMEERVERGMLARGHGIGQGIGAEGGGVMKCGLRSLDSDLRVGHVTRPLIN